MPNEVVEIEQPDGEVILLPARREARENLGGHQAIRGVRELARKYTTKAINELIRLVEHGRDERVRLAAAQAILNRGWGQPAMELKIEDIEGGASELIAARAKALTTLTNDPDYLRKVLVVMQANGLLPTGAPGEDIVPATREDAIAEMKMEQETRDLDAEDAADKPSVPCHCGGTFEQHPGRATCEHCLPCRLYVPVGTEGTERGRSYGE